MMSLPIMKISIKYEHDIVLARQRARTIAELLGFDTREQTQISTAVSEITRNAYKYAGGGEISFLIEGKSKSQIMIMKISDQGPGIEDLSAIIEGRFHSKTGMGLGLIGAKKLMDYFHLESTPGKGTIVTFGKNFPPEAPPVDSRNIITITDQLIKQTPSNPYEEVQQQNQELLRAMSELQESELRHRALVEAIPDLLFRYNSEGVCLDAAIKEEKLLYNKARQLQKDKVLIGKSIVETLPAKIAETLMNGIRQALSSGEIHLIEYSYLADGNEYYFEARLAPIGNAEVVSIVRDVTERKRYMAELERISLHDQLTGLYNRHYFNNELERLSLSRDYPITIVSADLDGLKLVNDTMGHAEGDRYLQAGADLIKGVLRASDILARVGGDEFAFVLPRTDREAAEGLITRLLARIDQYNSQLQKLPISISFGLAVSPSKERSLEETYKEADNAMYNDKFKRSQMARAKIVGSLVKTLSIMKNLGEGNRAQVEKLADRFGRHLQLGEKEFNNLQLLAKVYDLGKVNMPDRLVHSKLKEKEGELTTAERETIRRHPEIGYRIASSSPGLSKVADLILRHHENYDGSGYPLGIEGDDIALECRIMAIIIAYSAMTNRRPYAKILKAAEALEELKRCAATQFDPQLVEKFLALLASEPK